MKMQRRSLRVGGDIAQRVHRLGAPGCRRSRPRPRRGSGESFRRRPFDLGQLRRHRSGRLRQANSASSPARVLSRTTLCARASSGRKLANPAALMPSGAAYICAVSKCSRGPRGFRAGRRSAGGRGVFFRFHIPGYQPRPSGRFQCIEHERGDGHGTDAARHRTDPAGAFLGVSNSTSPTILPRAGG